MTEGGVMAGTRTVRGLITAGAVGALVWAVVLGGGGAATAIQGSAVIAGQLNSATNQTQVNNTLGGISDTLCSGGGGGTQGFVGCGSEGVDGKGVNYGVAGTASSANGAGVLGQGTTGVVGAGFHGPGISGSGTPGVEGAALFADDNGVWGHTDGSGSGVYGETSGTGNGVLGYAPTATAVKGQTTSGIGVLATATGSGTALNVSGRAQFSRSGVVTITYPAKSAVISAVPVTAKSIALATIQKYLTGVYVVAAVPNLSGSSNSFTIYLNKAPGSSTAPKSVVVGWQVIERP